MYKFFLLKKHNIQYTNPFTWCEVTFDSMYSLILNFENINWDTYKIGHRPCGWNENVNYYFLDIDDKIKITYPHYLLDYTRKSPIKIGENVYYEHIEEFIINKYNERLTRMKNTNEKPVFLIEWDCFDYDANALEKLIKTDLKYKVIVITNLIEYKDFKPTENLLIIYDAHEKGPNGWFPAQFATEYDSVIFSFLTQLQ